MKRSNTSPPESLLIPEALSKLEQYTTHDKNAIRKEYLFRPPLVDVWIHNNLLRDGRDAPIAWLFINILTITIPMAITLFYLDLPSSPLPHLLGLAYFIFNYVLFLQRFILALHYSQHRPLFTKLHLNPNHPYSYITTILNSIAPCFLAPFFGLPCGMYHLHHVSMHHRGNNSTAKGDVSSTEPYQRDSFMQFLCFYWTRYVFGGLIEVPLYAIRNKAWNLLQSCLVFETIYLTALWYLYSIRPIATLWVFLLPFTLSSFALMIGNWSQHIFICPDRNAGAQYYNNAYNCLAWGDNQKTFNDGYHAIHHLNPKLHWSEFPDKFMQPSVLEDMALHETFVFHSIGFVDIGIAVFLGNYDYLRRHMVVYTKKMAAMSDDEIDEEIKRRLKPIGGGGMKFK